MRISLYIYIYIHMYIYIYIERDTHVYIYIYIYIYIYTIASFHNPALPPFYWPLRSRGRVEAASAACCTRNRKSGH